jgi:hypothetical protein
MGANSMGETGPDTPLMAARRMLDIFASVGAERFHVTWTNSAGSPRRPYSLRSNLLSVANRNHRRPGSQSSDGRAQNHCNGSEGLDPESLRLGP